MATSDNLEALDEAILRACLATHRNAPRETVEKERQVLSEALERARKDDDADDLEK